MANNPYVKLTELICKGDIKRNTKYPVSLLIKKLTPEFSKGVPESLSSLTVWEETQINGEKAYIFAGMIGYSDRTVIKDPYDTLMILLAECKIKKNVRYSASFLGEHFSEEFQSGVPSSISSFSRWRMIEENGEKHYIYQGVFKFRGTKANAA